MPKALTKLMLCKVHGDTEHYLHTKKYWRCKKCNSFRVAERRRKVKKLLVEEHGGACTLCGYNKCLKALHFHHKDSNGKDFGISAKGLTKGLDKLREEANKCILVCANCHAEIHDGLVEI